MTHVYKSLSKILSESLSRIRVIIPDIYFIINVGFCMRYLADNKSDESVFCVAFHGTDPWSSLSLALTCLLRDIISRPPLMSFSGSNPY